MNQQQYGPNQQYLNQQYPSQQYPNQRYPNQQYPNQQYPNQMGGYNQKYQTKMGGGMMGPGIGFGGTMLLGEQILRHVSFFPFCLTPNDNLLTRSLSMSYISSSPICQQTMKWPKLYRLWIRLSSRPCRYRDQDRHWMESIEYNDSSFQLKPARNTPAPKNAFPERPTCVFQQQQPGTNSSKTRHSNVKIDATKLLHERRGLDTQTAMHSQSLQTLLGGLRFNSFPIESQHSVTWAAGYCKYSVFGVLLFLGDLFMISFFQGSMLGLQHNARVHQNRVVELDNRARLFNHLTGRWSPRISSGLG
jgi:hypothetical protein